MILPTIAPDKWVELQAEISDAWLQDMWFASFTCNKNLLCKAENGDVRYTDDAQEKFNGIYDRVDTIMSSVFEKGNNQ
tara:strand:- start:387 stop:620 length:234 start_codon:yes stop_codon:yes gene_type:complete